LVTEKFLPHIPIDPLFTEGVLPPSNPSCYFYATPPYTIPGGYGSIVFPEDASNLPYIIMFNTEINELSLPKLTHPAAPNYSPYYMTTR
jgi:hypothetical protein